MSEEIARIFVIKNMVTDECYYGVTTTKDISKFNPIKFLYRFYMKDKNKFTNLGASIDEHTIVKFKYFFLKEIATKEAAIELCNELKKRPEATLNKPPQEKLEKVFKKEIDAFNEILNSYLSS